MKKNLAIWVVCLIWIMPSRAWADEIVYFDRPKLVTDKRGQDLEFILKRVLAVTGDPYGKAGFQYTPHVMSRTRSLKEIKKGQILHVMAVHPKADWDRETICIQFPLRKGLLSYRLFLIRKESQSGLSGVTTLEQLRKIPTGSGQQWSITQAFQQDRFNLVTGISYDGLFSMLNVGRFRTFSRGINEIYDELETYRKIYPDLVIEKDLLLYVYIPTYFYVSPKKPELARRVRQGLDQLYETGEFDRIFQRFHGRKISRSRLGARRFFRIANPNVSEERFRADKKYLYFPGSKN